MDLPEKNRAKLYNQLLRTHLFGSATKGAFFGLHKGRQEILLFKEIAARTLDKDNFLPTIAEFAAQANLWGNAFRHEINNYSV